MYLYEMQIRPWNPRRNNSFSHYMDVSHSVSRVVNASLLKPRHDKTNKMTVRPAKTQISLGIRPV